MNTKQIEDLIAANQAETNRTPFLDAALGGLRTALDNVREHAAELERRAKARPATAKDAAKN